ncbi:transposase [Cucumis melo var. makuwa]|uniref:Transposase n=1 Tax=Cucumis melo var. makuwa TaxID=1194695 RepID=A0A5A7UAQ3_CUCMM|nr:transposase [Cucumis melo var. makuwa]
MWPTFGSEPRNLRLGLKQPGYDINTYLAPLIDDLKILWEEGVRCFDAYKEEYFTLQVVLLWTINDFPVYEHGNPPQPLSEEAIYFKLKEMIFSCGKKCGKNNNEGGNDYWKRRSDFFELPYRKNLHVRHCLDVMHIEKIVCMNIVGTLLDILGKSKDGMNSRLDLVEMNIRPELAPMVTDNRTYIPAACYTLSREEKYRFCKTLSEIKVPEGYSSNIRSLVSLDDLKLNGLKSHDCHVLMQKLLPIAIGSILPKNVRYTISRLYFFFNAICAKSFSVSKLDALQEDIVITLCNLEKYFPPSFFTIMVHLVVHLVREVKFCGPVYLWWMYPFKRYMKVLKSFVRNRNQPEGCIAKAQVCEEAVQFCSDFLSRLDPIGLGSLNSREDKQTDRPLSAGTYVRPDMQQLKQAHLHILQNTKEVMCELHEGKIVSNTIRWLAHGPNCGVMTFEGYMVNGCSYHTKSRDDHRTVQNSGIMLVATTMQVSSAKDKNPVIGDMSLYGIIEDIWESQNGIQQVTLMKMGIHTLELTVKAHGLPLDFHRTKPVGDTNPTDVATPKEKGESSTQKRKCSPTEMKIITRARSKGQKLVIQYNELSQAIGQNATKLKSFIGTTVRFHVPITYSDWPNVPKEINDKIFELIENAGVCFRQFKYRLTTTYVLPFLDDVEKLKFPPNEYSFIDQQHWTEFVASRLKEDFKKKSENGKEKRKKHKYNHRTSRKGYANLMEELKASSSDQIDRSIVWKQARMDRKGQIPDEETKEVVNLIDELVATQNTTNAFGEEDILTRALGGKDRPGILRDVGKYVTKKKIKELEEELLKMKEKDDCVGDLKEELGMSSKEKSSMEGAENVNDLEDLSNDLELEKDVEDVVELNEDIKISIVKDDEEVEGVTLDKMKMDYGEFTKDMSTFAPTPIQNDPVALRFLLRMVKHMGSAIQITTPYDVFGVRRKCCIMIESLKDFTSMRPIATACLDAYIMYLYTRMESSRTLNLYKFVDAGNHWTLVVINLTKGAAFWIDHLKNRIDPDVTEVVERSFNIMNKKKPNWRIVKMKDSPRAYTQDDIDCISVLLIKKVLLKCVVDLGVLLLKCCVVDKKVLLKCVVDLEVCKYVLYVVEVCC